MHCYINNIFHDVNKKCRKNLVYFRDYHKFYFEDKYKLNNDILYIYC